MVVVTGFVGIFGCRSARPTGNKLADYTAGDGAFAVFTRR